MSGPLVTHSALMCFENALALESAMVALDVFPGATAQDALHVC